MTEATMNNSKSHDALQGLRRVLAQTMPENPALSGWKSYSQSEEDGIIRHCLATIEKRSGLSQTFVEIGCGNGTQNNTHQLLLDGFRGVWVDGDAQNISSVRENLPNLDVKKLLVLECFLTLENVDQFITEVCSGVDPQQLDFFSMDIDGNDVRIFEKCLAVCSPKVLCVEYNAKYPPPTRLVMDYNDSHVWANDDYFGASLQSWVDILSGYTLVACTFSGVNAFFVRNDFAPLFAQYSPALIYQPPRYWLCEGVSGHPPSLKWLRQLLC